MACGTPHDNPYCSLTEPKIRVDVGHERDRLERLERQIRETRDNGTDARRRRIDALWRAADDSRARLAAVQLGCAVGTGKGSRTRKP